MPNHHLDAYTERAPQGGPLSPLLSNILLDDLDHELERRKLRALGIATGMKLVVSEAPAERLSLS